MSEKTDHARPMRAAGDKLKLAMEENALKTDQTLAFHGLHVNNMDITYSLALPGPGRKKMTGSLRLHNVPLDAEISERDLRTVIADRIGISATRVQLSGIFEGKSYLAHDIASKIVNGSILQEKSKVQIHSELQTVDDRIQAALRMVQELERRREILQIELSEAVFGGRRRRMYRRNFQFTRL